MTPRRAGIVVLLAMLLVLPPLAMAYYDCAGMSQVCEATCAAMVGVVVSPATSTAPDLVMCLALQPPPLLPAIIAPSLDPPPRFPLLAA